VDRILKCEMFENLVVGVDGHQAGRDALALAAQLASPRAQIALVYVQVVMPSPDPDSGARSLAADRAPVLASLEALRAQSRVAARVLWIQAHSVATGLREIAAERGADLLVIGASRTDAVERAFVGDDTRAVLGHAPCPVAVAPRGQAERTPALARIAAAYDGSAASERAVAVARALARAHDAALTAFEAVPEPLYLHDPGNPEPEIDQLVASARERVSALGDIEPHAAAGEAVEQLARFAASADLLVLGAHTRRPLDHLTDGSTAQRLAETPPCALLVLG
jgi:nucleotide-binding universal stress UspA family protein